MLARGLTYERLLLGGEGQMAVRLWSSGLHGLSMASLPRLRPSCHLLCNFSTFRASVVPSSQARESIVPAALEDAMSGGIKKKERLSREERTALVESFVLRHMEAHQGVFPSVSVVLKGTGGGRNVVKDILSDLEGRLGSENVLQKSTKVSSHQEVTNQSLGVESTLRDVALSTQDIVGEDKPYDLSDEVEVSEVSEESNESIESGDEETDMFDDPEVTSEEYKERSRGRQELLNKSTTLTNGKMTSNQGEIENYSGLWSRLRGMGTSLQSPQQAPKQQAPSQDATRASRRHWPAGQGGGASKLLKQNLSGNETLRENGSSSQDYVALTYDSTTENELKDPIQHGVWKEELLGTEDRHGLFIRYLSPQATPNDMRDAFADCGEIIRAQAIKSRTNSKYTYGFVDFKTAEGLQNALEKDKVYIKGVRIQKEPSSSTPRSVDRSLSSNGWAVDFRSPKTTEQSSGSSFASMPKSEGFRGASFKVAVEGIPVSIPLSDVQRALSKYGEIILSDMKQDNFGAYCATLEFKTSEGREKALSARLVQLNGMQYAISRVDPVKTSVVRLSNVGLDPNDGQIGATCELFGRVEKVLPRSDGSVDVFFRPSEMENIPRILSRLNEVTLEGQRWVAQPAPRFLPGSNDSLLKTREPSDWLDNETDVYLSNIEEMLKKAVAELEALQDLLKYNRRPRTKGQ